MKNRNSVLVLVALSTLALGTAAQARELSCDVSRESSPFDVSIDSNRGIDISHDGGELGGSYKADPSQDTSGYAAYKIVPRDQDGEQPDEAKVSRKLLTGPKGTKGFVWLAPGILGGSFHCEVTEE
jgi:hypothetical protein